MTRWAILLALGVAAAQPASGAAPPPELAVVIEVDGLTADLFQRYRGHLSGGLGRLARGVVYADASSGSNPVGSFGAEVTEPGITGIISGSTSIPPGFDNRWTWNGRQFADNAKVSASRVLPVANQAIGALIATAEPGLIPPPACASASPSARFARAAGDTAAFSSSPALDGAVLAVGAGMVGELKMGVDNEPDLITLRLPALADTVGRFGTESEAACLHLLSIDRDLAGFFSQLDRGGIEYVVGLAGSGETRTKVPLLFWRAGMEPAVRQDPVSTNDMDSTIAAILGIPNRAGQMPGKCLTTVAGAACPD